MDKPERSETSEFLDAIARLSAVPAKALRSDTYFHLPISMTIDEAEHCAHLARNENSFTFLRNDGTVKTRLILRTVNEAWQHEKIPTVAICGSERAAKDLQQTTGIESHTAEEFFNHLKLSRPVSQTFTRNKSYVIGHDHNPHGRFDEIVLPARANVIVYEAEKFSTGELATLCDHVAQVRGRVVLCADNRKFDRSHPEIGQVLDDFFGSDGPEVDPKYDPNRTWVLGNDLDPRRDLDDIDLSSAGDGSWVVVADSPWEAGVKYVRSIHSSRLEALNALPSAFADEWQDQNFLFLDSWPDSAELPSVAPAEWRAVTPPQIGQRVQIENHAVVATVAPHERLPLSEHIKPDTAENDPFVKAQSYLVFHAKANAAHRFPEDYKLVAKVEAPNIDGAVLYSQRNGRSWTNNPGITAFSENPRSTQVGDVVVDHDVPKRYLGADKWEPAATNMHPIQIHKDGPADMNPAPLPHVSVPITHSPKRKF